MCHGDERLGDGISNRWDDNERGERGGYMCDERDEEVHRGATW